MPTDWRGAFFQQAWSDFQIVLLIGGYDAVSDARTPRESAYILAPCQRLHYLQMVLEKLGKAYGTPRGGAQPERNHRGADRLMRHFKQAPDSSNGVILQTLKFADKRRLYAHIDSLRPMAAAIEALSPNNAGNGPNAEYPWSTDPAKPRRSIVSPARHAFHEAEFDIATISKLVGFLKAVFKSLEAAGELE